MNETESGMRPAHRVAMPWLAAFLLVSLAGCGNLLDTTRPAEQRYWLAPLASPPAIDAVAPLSLEVTVAPGLDTDRVMVLHPDARIDGLAQARWPDHLPDVLESVLQRSLARAGVEVVESSSRANDKKCMLRIKIEEYFYVYRNVNSSRISMMSNVRYRCDDFSREFGLESSVPAGGAEPDIIRGFQQALDALTRELISRLQPGAG